MGSGQNTTPTETAVPRRVEQYNFLNARLPVIRTDWRKMIAKL